MITKKTVLVLGAGASLAYGLPAGPELKAKVIHNLGQPGTANILGELGHCATFIRRFAKDLADSHPASIDAYLAIREDYITIGKQAIAATLIPLEEQKELFRKWYIPYYNPSVAYPDNGHWYQELCGMMDPMMKLDENELAVITFNYDRSLEQYMYTSLRNLYGPYGPSGDMSKDQADKECEEKVKAIPIIHVYGQLGVLPWDNSGKDQLRYGPGGPFTPGIVREAAKCIEIMPEARQESPIFSKTNTLISDAERIYFLGFGFDPTNVRRLLPPGLMKAKCDKMYGTLCGLSRPQRQFLARHGFKEAMDDLIDSDARPPEVYRDPDTYRFRDQNICAWLKDNTHALFD